MIDINAPIDFSFLTSFTDFLTNPWLWLTITVLFVLKQAIKIVPQNRGYVIYTLGKYSGTLHAGLNFIIPFYQRIEANRNLKEQTLTINSQTAITKDNITLGITGVLYIKVTDAGKATYGVTDYKTAVIELAMTTMRSAIGAMELDQCFQNRTQINAKIIEGMLQATDPWGVSVIRYEIKDITPPASLKEDMEKQMSAEREKRSVILTAEGYRKSSIERAEGEKKSAVLAAEAEKAKEVLAAEGEKEKLVLEAAGKAEAITLVAEAEAGALETMGKVANSEAGKKAVELRLALAATDAHKAIAKESTVVLSDGKTGNSISETVAQAIAVSNSIKLNGDSNVS